jgi:2-phosphoglycerate kinase
MNRGEIRRGHQTPRGRRSKRIQIYGHFDKADVKTIVLANHKGGVGKSAVATLLAHYLVSRG